MSRSHFFRPFASKISFVRHGFSHRSLSRLSLGVAVALCALSLNAGTVRADEFSPVPASDPIYRQLRALDSSDLTATVKVGAGLTRYEAALQVARIITRVSNDNSAQLSRVGWRALRDLSSSLQSELSQLGIDVAAAKKLVDAKLKAPETSQAAQPPLDLNASTASDGADLRGTPGNGFLSGNRVLSGRTPGGFTFDNLSGSAFRQPGVASTLGLQDAQLNIAIVPRLRVGAALLAMQRAENDPFKSSGAGQALLSSSNSRVLSNDTSINYDVNSWLSVGAQSSRQTLTGLPDISPSLRAPFFAGASEARSQGGGAAVDVGPLTFSTKIEQLSTDAGARGTSVDGGVRLSAWQNRLSLSAHMARLQPEDNSVLESTRRELNIGLNVSQRLSLNLFYQGLFTQENTNKSERVTGGLNLSF